MEHRWSEHLATINVIAENQDLIEDALVNLEQTGFADIAILARGSLQQVQKANFCFITKVLSTLLNLIEPVNKQLQTHGFDMHNALSLIHTVREEIAALRNNEKFVEIAGDTVARDEAESQNKNARRPLARKRKVPERLGQFVAVDGGYEYEEQANAASSETRFRSLFFTVIDSCIAQFNERFNERNLSVVSAMNHLLR